MLRPKARNQALNYCSRESRNQRSASQVPNTNNKLRVKAAARSTTPNQLGYDSRESKASRRHQNCVQDYVNATSPAKHKKLDKFHHSGQFTPESAKSRNQAPSKSPSPDFKRKVIEKDRSNTRSLNASLILHGDIMSNTKQPVPHPAGTAIKPVNVGSRETNYIGREANSTISMVAPSGVEKDFLDQQINDFDNRSKSIYSQRHGPPSQLYSDRSKIKGDKTPESRPVSSRFVQNPHL